MKTKTKTYTLILADDGDITIIERPLANKNRPKCVYHKSYNPEDKIKSNLLKALETWEDLQAKALNDKPKIKE